MTQLGDVVLVATGWASLNMAAPRSTSVPWDSCLFLVDVAGASWAEAKSSWVCLSRRKPEAIRRGDMIRQD